MAPRSDGLNDSEQIVLDLRPHWWFLAPQAAALLVAIVGGLAVLFFVDVPQPLSLLIALVIFGVLVWFLVRYLVWSTMRFVITTDRLIKREGVLRRRGIEIPLERVNTVFFEQRLGERLIGSGDLVIESAGEQGSQLVPNIRKPLNVQNEIYRQMENNENRKFDRVGRNLGSSGDSIPDQIEKLADLYRQGVLTEDEFQTKKKQLLDRL